MHGTANWDGKPVRSIGLRSRKRRSQANVAIVSVHYLCPSCARVLLDSLDSFQMTHSTCFSPKKLSARMLMMTELFDTKEAKKPKKEETYRHMYQDETNTTTINRLPSRP